MPSPKPSRPLARFPALRWIAGVPSGADRADLFRSDQAAELDDVPTVPMHWDDEPAEGGARSCEHLVRAYAAHGGLLVGDQVVALLRQRRPQPLSVLGRWIVQREIVWFSHQDRLHLPMFQFHRGDMTVRAAVADILGTLRPAMDDLGIAEWFLKPNPCVAGRRPLEWLEAHPLVVARAARLERAAGRRAGP